MCSVTQTIDEITQVSKTGLDVLLRRRCVASRLRNTGHFRVAPTLGSLVHDQTPNGYDMNLGAAEESLLGVLQTVGRGLGPVWEYCNAYAKRCEPGTIMLTVT
jgi:hypothetical protein